MPDIVTILIAALALFVGTTIAFGYWFGDKKYKIDKKSKMDELNEIRMEIRTDSTASKLEDIWYFLNGQLNTTTGKKVWELLYESSIRRHFNKLLNELERTFRESMNVQNVCDNLKCKYGQMEKALYLFGAIEALIGYPLLASVILNSLSLEQYYLWGIGSLLAAIIFIGLIIYIQTKISYNLKIYNGYKKKYLDGVRKYPNNERY